MMMRLCVLFVELIRPLEKIKDNEWEIHYPSFLHGTCTQLKQAFSCIIRRFFMTPFVTELRNINPSRIFHFHHMNHFMLYNPPFKVVQLINIGVFLPPKRGLEWISVKVLVQLTFTSLPLTFPFKAFMHPQHLRSRIPINESTLSAVSFMGGWCTSCVKRKELLTPLIYRLDRIMLP